MGASTQDACVMFVGATTSEQGGESSKAGHGMGQVERMEHGGGLRGTFRARAAGIMLGTCWGAEGWLWQSWVLHGPSASPLPP